MAEHQEKKKPSVVAIAAPLVVVLVVVGAAAWYFNQTGGGIKITISEQRIQEAVEAEFPVERSIAGLAGASLVDPRVEIRSGEDRLTFTTGVEIDTPLRDPQAGTATVSSGIRYDPSTGSFYLQDPTIESIEAAGISVEILDKLSGPLARALGTVFNTREIYTLDSSDTAQRAAQLVLRSAEFRDGSLVLTLGL